MIRIGFPYPPFAWRLTRSAFIVWLALRFVLAAGLFLADGRAWTPPDWRAAALFVALPVAIVLLDMRIMREGIFFRDLGVDPGWVVLLAVLGVGVPELLADALLRLSCGCG